MKQSNCHKTVNESTKYYLNYHKPEMTENKLKSEETFEGVELEDENLIEDVVDEDLEEGDEEEDDEPETKIEERIENEGSRSFFFTFESFRI
jgi:hypothetical protein